MTVICQDTEREIAVTKWVRHSSGMPPQTDALLSKSIRDEMDPARIGYRLRLLRHSLKKKPSEMADDLDIPRTYWSRSERGHRAPSDELAAMLVERYGLTLDFLILGKWESLSGSKADELRSAIPSAEAELAKKNK